MYIANILTTWICNSENTHLVEQIFHDRHRQPPWNEKLTEHRSKSANSSIKSAGWSAADKHPPLLHACTSLSTTQKLCGRQWMEEPHWIILAFLPASRLPACLPSEAYVRWSTTEGTNRQAGAPRWHLCADCRRPADWPDMARTTETGVWKPVRFHDDDDEDDGGRRRGWMGGSTTINHCDGMCYWKWLQIQIPA